MQNYIIQYQDEVLSCMNFLHQQISEIENYPEKSREEHWKRFCEHMGEKYSVHGYITLWIPGSPNEANLKKIRATLADKVELRRVFDQLFDEEKSE